MMIIKQRNQLNFQKRQMQVQYIILLLKLIVCHSAKEILNNFLNSLSDIVRLSCDLIHLTAQYKTLTQQLYQSTKHTFSSAIISGHFLVLSQKSQSFNLLPTPSLQLNFVAKC